MPEVTSSRNRSSSWVLHGFPLFSAILFLQPDVEPAALVSDFAALSIYMGNCETLGRKRGALRFERFVARRFIK